jgi:hypothetical protein
MIKVDTNYLREWAKGFAEGLAIHEIFDLDDLWHGYSQDIDVNFYIDDFGLVHATAYEVFADGQQGEFVTLF